MISTRQGSRTGGSGHPLLNDVVLQEVLKYSTVKDLNNHRLVCRKWYEASLFRWKSDITVKVYPSDSDRPEKESSVYTKRYEGLSVRSLLSLLDKEEKVKSGKPPNLQLAAKPFENYCLKSWDFTTEPTSETVELFTRLGPRMKSMLFQNCTFPDNNIIEVENFLRFCPNLKKIIFYNDDHHEVMIFWSPPFLLQIFNGVGQILRVEQLDLTYANHYTTAEHQRIQQNSPNLFSDLQALSIPVNDPTPDITILLLEFHRFTLQRLTLRRNKFRQPFDTLEFKHTFENLTELKLIGSVVNSLSLLRWMPKLEKLNIEQYPLCYIEYIERTFRNVIYRVEAADLFKNAENAMRNVVLLNMNSVSFGIELEVRNWEILQNWMPNLSILRAVLNNPTFLTVTALWPQLKELCCLSGSNLDDSSIVPVIDETMRELYAGNLVGITALKDLWKFEQEPNSDIPGKLTELSATEGFLKMEKLTSLQICVASKNFSVKMVNQLKSKIFQVRVIRNTPAGSGKVQRSCTTVHRHRPQYIQIFL